MDKNKEKVALCALNKIFGYHPALALELMENADGAQALFGAEPPPVKGHPELQAQLGPRMLEWAARELERVQASGFRFIGLRDEDYPPLLRECPDPPLGLYVNGSSSPTEIFSLRPMVAFVGTRDMSPYGKTWCRRLVEALSRTRNPPCIVSGLAFGVDGIAHRTALECGLPTVGVMATGIEKVYPRQHERLAMDMVRAPGSGVLTDYPLGTAPVALNFLRRNRIIAGLADAVVVVESKSKGGSLMTAKYAMGYNRDVFAVPGRLDDVRSEGCNSLIHEHMADIVTSPEDLAACLGLGAPVRGAGGSWAVGTAAAGSAADRPTGGGTSEQRTDGGATDGTASALTGDPFIRALERRFGPTSLFLAVGLAVRDRPGITAEELAASQGKPFVETLAAMSQLEAEGFLETDLLRRCFPAPPWK